MPPLDWLACRQDGLGSDTTEVREALAEFSILWRYIEVRVISAPVSAQSIGRFAEAISSRQDGEIPSAVIGAVAELRSLFAPDSQLGVGYLTLRLSRGVNENQTRSVLLNKEESLRAMVVCLLTVYRRYNELLLSRVLRRHGMFKTSTQIRIAIAGLIAIAELLQPSSAKSEA